MLFPWKQISLLLASVFLPWNCGGGSDEAASVEGRLAPLLENIGNLHHEVTTDSEMAQRFFDQGLSLYWGFNHAESARSFEEAARLDPNCAMAYWGQAVALGPNINDPLADPNRLKQAYEKSREALRLKGSGTEKEQALIDALAVRYAPDPAADRGPLNQAYADAMTQVNAKFGDDPDVATLYAESVMDTMPWDYWTEDSQPKPGVAQVLTALETVMANHGEHPGANHLYIHAVEASNDPDRAVPSADKLGGLIPVAGHLVHMPSHIYIRVGRYADASQANRDAILADEDYISQCRAQGLYPIGYYPHNIHFLWAALAMEGRSEEATEAARSVASKHTDDHLQMQGFGFGHLLRTIPLFSMVRFAQWDAILAEPAPSPDLAFGNGIWHWARGLAFANQGKAQEAGTELEQVRTIAADARLAQLDIFGGNTLDKMMAIAVEFLAGEIAAKQGNVQVAIGHLQKAVELEDGLRYSEPPDWPLPPREWLGAALREGGQPAEAERIYRENLNRHRDNGWGLFGLMRSLEAQGKTQEAAEAKLRFDRAWANAEFPLTAESR